MVIDDIQYPSKDGLFRFVAAFGDDVLKNIVSTKVPITFGIRLSKTFLVEVIPSEKESMWTATVRYHQLSRFLRTSSKIIGSTMIEIGKLKNKNSSDMVSITTAAIREFDDETLRLIALSKEPITFSYLDDVERQVEVHVHNRNGKITIDVQID